MASLDDKFKVFLSKIGDKLGPDEVKELKFLWRHRLPAQSSVKSSEDLFDLLIDRGLLSASNTEFLERGLEARGLNPCIELINTFKTENEEELQRISTDISTAGSKGPCNLQKEMIVKHFQETSKLNELKEAMLNKDFITLTGILGCGKSQIALYYAWSVFRETSPEGICWKIACQDELALMTSLKNLLKDLTSSQDKSKMDEDKSNETSINLLRGQIKEEIEKRFLSKCNLVVLDDVMPDTKHLCETLKDTLTGLNVKVIVTTMDSTFCNPDEKIIMKGFSEEEAILFLQRGKQIRQEDKDFYSRLVTLLVCHPLLLHGAMSWMNANNLTPRKFIKYLKGIKEMEKLVRNLPDQRQKMFAILEQYLHILKESVDEDVFDMVLVLQFLGTEDIPVLFFEFLPTREGQRQVFNANEFLSAMQKFSFGILRGEDDERFITTHLAVLKTIEKINLPVEEKIRLVKKILSALVWLMDKDNMNPKDFERMRNLMPHAHSVLKHAHTLTKQNPEIAKDLEMNVLLAYVHDVVGYTYNFLGDLKDAGEQADEARRTCFEIIGDSEENIEEKISKDVPRDNNFKSWDAFAKIEAGFIFDKLKEVVSQEKTRNTLTTMTESMILNKYRSMDHIKLLQLFLGSELEEEYILTEQEFEILRNKQLVFPNEILGPALLYEVVLQVFYTYGRRLFYLGDAYKVETARKFSHSLFLAYHLGQKIQTEIKDWNILYVMLTEVSGVLLLPLDFKANLEFHTKENLENSIAKYESFAEKESKQFVYGIIKDDTSRSNVNMYLCTKNLVKCIAKLAPLITDESKRKEIIEKEKMYERKLDECKKYSRQERSASLSKAEYLMSTDNYMEAESYFKQVAPDDIIDFEKEMKNTKLLSFELQALKGLIQCFVHKGQVEEAKKFIQRIKARLTNTKEEEECEMFDKFTKDLKLSSDE